RLVLVGSSHEQGNGVKDDQTYENLVEDSLNQQLSARGYSRYEILNLSVSGYSILQRLLRLEQEGFEYQPDAAVLCMAAVDHQFRLDSLRKAFTFGFFPPSVYRDFLDQIPGKPGVDGKILYEMIERPLLPYAPKIDVWASRRFAEQCRQRGVRPIVMSRPAPA